MDRSFPEDAEHENGQYWCKCCDCGLKFIGHKRRVQCKLCELRYEADGGPTPTRTMLKIIGLIFALIVCVGLGIVGKMLEVKFYLWLLGK